MIRACRDFPEPWSWRGGRGHEVRLLTELRALDVPVAPDTVVLAEVDGLPSAFLERRVTGAVPTATEVAGSPALLRGIADLLDRMHAVHSDTAADWGLRRDDTAADLREAFEATRLQSALAGRVEAAITVLAARTHRTLCHRDFRLDHLRTDGGLRITGLLDLGDAGIDDPAGDLALLHGELGAPAVRVICAAMGSADPGLAEAAGLIHDLRPLLELAPGGETWGEPDTAEARLAASFP